MNEKVRNRRVTGQKDVEQSWTYHAHQWTTDQMN